MSFKKTLASIVLSGAIALGIGGNKARADYFEDFSSDPGWIVSNPLTMHQTTFQGDGVFKVQPENVETQAYLPFELRGNQRDFTLEWDSYITGGIATSEPQCFIQFGVWEDPGFINYLTGYLTWEGPNKDCGIGVMFNGTGRGSARDLTDKWIHNVLTYDKDEKRAELISYDGKGNTTNTLFDYNNSIINSLGFNGTNRIGYSSSTGYGGIPAEEYPLVYLDNIHFQEIPEPTSLGLLALGSTALALMKRKRGDKPVRR